jgi:hypothetical protein
MATSSEVWPGQQYRTALDASRGWQRPRQLLLVSFRGHIGEFGIAAGRSVATSCIWSVADTIK